MEYFISGFGRYIDDEGRRFIGSGDKSLIVSIPSVGTFFGALMSAQAADTLGRKRGLMLSSVVFTVRYLPFNRRFNSQDSHIELQL